jgi:type I restriction enzyme S subunit
MEVKPGYKQTEVGMIPEDWDVKSTSQIANPVRGGSPRPAGDPKFFNGSFIPWLTVAALTNIPSSKLVVTETAACLTEEGSLHSRTLNSGTIIIANSGATLGVAKVLGIKCCANDGIAALLNLSKEVSGAYLTHFINTRTSYLREVVATGNGQPNLNTRLIGRLKIPLPPTKDEQERIAAALGDVDAFIESLEQLSARKRHLKQGVMEELLTGKNRLPGFKVRPGYKQTEVGIIPEDWEVAALGGLLATAPAYGINAPAIPYDSRYPTYLRITDISEDGRFIDESKASVNHPLATDYRLSEGDLVFARTGASVGKSYLYDRNDGELVFAGFLIRIRPDAKKLLPAYLKYFAHSNSYWNWVRVNSMRSGQPGINGREYASLPIPLSPTTAEQEAIAETLSDMDTEMAALDKELAKIRKLKHGMMQELLTGRIRLI